MFTGSATSATETFVLRQGSETIKSRFILAAASAIGSSARRAVWSSTIGTPPNTIIVSSAEMTFKLRTISNRYVVRSATSSRLTTTLFFTAASQVIAPPVAKHQMLGRPMHRTLLVSRGSLPPS
ncbi:hypothetical protein PM082_003884 [Marasmius tenuissimus]|nr:hypothetical protein PM082_003884 [Marasmius tenuissimus]